MDVSGKKVLKVDASGRFFLPKGCIEPVLGDDGEPRLPELWLCPSAEGCLQVVDKQEYRRLQKRMRSSEYGNKRTHELQRFFFGLTSRVKADRSGRITISEEQREFAAIVTGELFFQGLGRRIELWGMELAKAMKLLSPASKAKDKKFMGDLSKLLQGERLDS
ncbi:MAG: hypothetical protein CSA62_04090 [Planctomycetota bacterium]|nr:MAG: hypothetical protein CSA62_04090 [Planctomycetota bacterium]